MPPSHVSGTVVITGMGMISSLGPDLTSSCAAARAGMTRAYPLDVLDFSEDQLWDNQPVVGHPVGYLTQGFTGIGRLYRLGDRAIRDLLDRASLSESILARTALYVNFSDNYYEGTIDSDADASAVMNLPINGDTPLNWREQLSQLVARLSARHGMPTASDMQASHSGGHVGLLEVLANAIGQIRVGRLELCIVGGIDSCIDAAQLKAAARCGVVKTATNPAGFMPGEAAAFFIVEGLEHALRRGADIIAAIDEPAISIEQCHRLSDEPPLGEALAQAIVTSYSERRSRDEAPGFTIGDLNGDPWRASEWGYALTRLPDSISLAGVPLLLPALSFGETGAATGAVAVCMGARGMQRGYLRADRILAWLSSENGKKGALQLGRFSS